MTKYTVKDVTRDLSHLMTLTRLFEVDSEGYLKEEDKDNRFIYKLEGEEEEGKPIVVFQDPMPKGDYYVFNPFAEGLGQKSPAVQLYYKTIRIALNLAIESVALHVTQALVDSKKPKGESPGHEIVRMSSVQVDRKQALVDVVDDKTVEEFKTLFKRMNAEVVYVAYIKTRMTAVVKVDALADPKWDERFGEGIRKKSLSAFKSLLLGILGLEAPKDVDTFSTKYDPEIKSAARIHTIMSVYFKLYDRFNDVIGAAFGPEVDLTELQGVIERFPLAYAIAKHMIQPSVQRKGAVDTSTSDTSGISFGGENKSRFTPVTVDSFGFGTQGGQNGKSFSPAQESGNRFRANIINEGNDPFNQPLSSAASPQASRFAQGGNSGSMFNQPVTAFGSGFGGGFNAPAPMNFGSPTSQRRFF